MENISIYNYEAWMFDYLEGNLDNEKKRLFFRFMEANPDLREEYEMMKSAVLKPEKINFDRKHLLLKSTDPLIDMPETDYLLIKQMEEGLTESEQIRLNELVKLFPSLIKDSQSYKLTKLQSQQVTYSKKSSLLRKNYQPRIWAAIGSVAAAAAILFFLLKPATNLPTSNKTFISDLTYETNKKEEIIVEQPIVAEVVKPEPVNKSIYVPQKSEIAAVVNNTQTPEIKDDEIQFISKPDLQLFPQVKKINAYETGLNMMLPQYIENNRLLLAFELEQYDYKSEPERGNIIKAGLRLINRISQRNIVIENYFLTANTNAELHSSY